MSEPGYAYRPADPALLRELKHDGLKRPGTRKADVLTFHENATTAAMDDTTLAIPTLVRVKASITEAGQNGRRTIGRKVNTSELEYLGTDGAWHPLEDLSRDIDEEVSYFAWKLARDSGLTSPDDLDDLARTSFAMMSLDYAVARAMNDDIGKNLIGPAHNKFRAAVAKSIRDATGAAVRMIFRIVTLRISLPTFF